MYQALYRSHRPLRFDQVYGQQHITKTLENQLLQNTVGHAYLFTGTRGTGKTTCAKILARAVNCENPDGANPCNRCAACLSALADSAPDITEMDAATNTQVDKMRDLLEEASYAPTSMRKRVYIIDEVHMLSSGAFNAMLKTLEEPPAHVLFILATTELHKVPATILSRCQRFDFHRISPEIIAQHLLEVASDESIPLNPDGALLLGRLADGSVRDSLSLLERCRAVPQDTVLDADKVKEVLGLANENAVSQLAEAVITLNPSSALEELERIYQDGRDLRTVLDSLSLLLRDVLVYASTNSLLLCRSGTDDSRIVSLAEQIQPERILQLIRILTDTISRMQRNGGDRTDAEICLIKLCTPASNDEFHAVPIRPAAISDNPAVLKRLSALENTLQNLSIASASSLPSNDEMVSESSAKSKSISEETAPAELQTVAPLSSEYDDALCAAVHDRLDSMPRAFLKSCSKYWDGHTLTLVGDDYALVPLSQDDRKTALQQAMHEVLGPSARLVFSDHAPIAVPNDTSGFDIILKNYRESGGHA